MNIIISHPLCNTLHQAKRIIIPLTIFPGLELSGNVGRMLSGDVWKDAPYPMVAGAMAAYTGHYITIPVAVQCKLPTTLQHLGVDPLCRFALYHLQTGIVCGDITKLIITQHFGKGLHRRVGATPLTVILQLSNNIIRMQTSKSRPGLGTLVIHATAISLVPSHTRNRSGLPPLNRPSLWLVVARHSRHSPIAKGRRNTIANSAPFYLIFHNTLAVNTIYNFIYSHSIQKNIIRKTHTAFILNNKKTQATKSLGFSCYALGYFPSRKDFSLSARLGWRNLRNALASICRIRSRVTSNCLPTSSSV